MENKRSGTETILIPPNLRVTGTEPQRENKSIPGLCFTTFAGGFSDSDSESLPLLEPESLPELSVMMPTDAASTEEEK